MKFIYVRDVYDQSVVLKLLAILLHNWQFYFISKISVDSIPERQVPDRSGTN